MYLNIVLMISKSGLKRDYKYCLWSAEVTRLLTLCVCCTNASALQFLINSMYIYNCVYIQFSLSPSPLPLSIYM